METFNSEDDTCTDGTETITVTKYVCASAMDGGSHEDKHSKPLHECDATFVILVIIV